MATLEQIAQLGHPEKDAARVYSETGPFPGRRSVVPGVLTKSCRDKERMAFLQGIHWERERAKREGLDK